MFLSPIGIPLTILQFVSNPDLPLHPLEVCNNFVVAHAVYDADRQPHPSASTRLACLASTGYFLAHAETVPLAPLVPALHFGYRSLKAWIPLAKPFVVAILWTLCVYSVPLLLDRGAWFDDPITPAALFLSLSSLSHASDVVDADEDRAHGVRTIATEMTRDEASAYAITLGLAAAFLHSNSPHPSLLYDSACLTALAAILSSQERVAVLLGAAYLTMYASTHDVELLSGLIRSTETTHEVAISLGTNGVEAAFRLPEPWRTRAVEGILHCIRAGDAAGASILRLYEEAIRDRLGEG